MNSIRVLLADDHALFRAGLRAILHSMPGTEVVAEAENGRDALQLIGEQRPDVAMLDISMPELSGLEALRRITKEHPDVRVIMLSMHSSTQYVMQSLEAGAAGYLLKDSALSELEEALRTVARGEMYIGPSLTRSVIDAYKNHTTGRPAGTRLLSVLTSRQREVLQLIAEGHSTKEIARKLDMSVKTADTHRSQLMKRLGIHDVAGLVRFAVACGLITPED
ncbi:MAG TPA: response regulator transcription factor [Bacteroidota bacterium]|nr:response regulator transcription factor [Bacteroidota bacterium]